MQSRAADIYRISRVILVKNGWLFFIQETNRDFPLHLLCMQTGYLTFCFVNSLVVFAVRRRDMMEAAGASLALHSGSQAGVCVVLWSRAKRLNVPSRLHRSLSECACRCGYDTRSCTAKTLLFETDLMFTIVVLKRNHFFTFVVFFR